MRGFTALIPGTAACLTMGVAPARADGYPDHPVTVLTMTGPGAQIDLLTRAMAEKLKSSLGQPVSGRWNSGRNTPQRICRTPWRATTARLPG